MWKTFFNRLLEPSTWLGLGGAVAVAGEAWKVPEAPAIADALGQTGQAIASGLPWYQWLPLAVGSAMGVVMAERSKR